MEQDHTSEWQKLKQGLLEIFDHPIIGSFLSFLQILLTWRKLWCLHQYIHRQKLHPTIIWRKKIIKHKYTLNLIRCLNKMSTEDSLDPPWVLLFEWITSSPLPCGTNFLNTSEKYLATCLKVNWIASVFLVSKWLSNSWIFSSLKVNKFLLYLKFKNIKGENSIKKFFK